jgi:Gp49-like protein DUF891
LRRGNATYMFMVRSSIKSGGLAKRNTRRPHPNSAKDALLFRVVYAVQLGADVWVIHAFQKKSKTGIRTPKHEIDLIEARLRRVKEMVQ